MSLALSPTNVADVNDPLHGQIEQLTIEHRILDTNAILQLIYKISKQGILKDVLKCQSLMAWFGEERGFKQLKFCSFYNVSFQKEELTFCKIKSLS